MAVSDDLPKKNKGDQVTAVLQIMRCDQTASQLQVDQIQTGAD